MKKEKIKIGKSKRVRILMVTATVIVLLVAGVIVFLKVRGGKGGNSFPFNMGNMQLGQGQLNLTENMIVQTGVTNVGVTSEIFDVENMTTKLDIEEVYITSNEMVEEGTKICKISEESISEARKELEELLKSAELAYRSGEIEYEQTKITAAFDRDSTILTGDQAEEVYKETLSGLDASVEKAQAELDQAKADIAEYQSYVNDNSYRSYFKVDEYQAAYDKTLETLKSKMEEWGVTWAQVTGSSGINTGVNDIPSGSLPSGDINTGGMPQAPELSTYNLAAEETPTVATPPASESGQEPEITPTPGAGDPPNQPASGPSSDQVMVLASLYDVLESQLKELEQATSEYEDACANASFRLQTLELSLPDLETALMEAKKNYQNQVLQAKVTYEKALTSANSANGDYEAAMEKAETTYQSVKKAYEDAKKNLESFENSVGDGYFYAPGRGTVLRVMVRAGQKLSAQSTLFMYSNQQEITVTVSVDQAQIAAVALDDTVSVLSENNEIFEGIVTEINPVSNSSSRSSVSYSVTVKLLEVSEQITANQSVSVIFGADKDTLQSLISQTKIEETQKEEDSSFDDKNAQDVARPENGELPEGFTPGQMPGDGELPEGFTPGQMPGDGELPEGFTPGQMPGDGGMPDKGRKVE